MAISTIALDDVINAAEAARDLEIAGSSSGVAGQTVTVNFNGASYSGSVGPDGSWSVTVPEAALLPAVLPDADYEVTADVTASDGNAAPQATRTLTVHQTIPMLAINAIAGDDMLNGFEATQGISIFGTSAGASGRNVLITFDGAEYAAIVGDDGAWSAAISLPTRSQPQRCLMASTKSWPI